MKKYLILIISIIISINCNAQSKKDLSEILDFVNADSILRTVQDLQDFGTRRANKPPNGNIGVAQYLVNRLKSYGIDNAHIQNFTYAGYSGYNVLATIGGEVPDSTVIFGAHLDCMNSYNGDLLAPAPGADDNASGCAQVIEMARICFEQELMPRYNIDFMLYDYEEFGLFGAYWDAQRRKVANEKIVVMINNDMVGYQVPTDQWRLTLHWYPNSLDVTDKAIEYCNNYTTITPIKPTESVNYSMYSRSDSYAYYASQFKTTFNIEYTFSPFYHMWNDLLEYLNFEYQKQIGRLNLAMLIDYSNISLLEDSIPNDTIPNDTIPDDSTYLRNWARYVEVFPNPATDFVRVHNYNAIEINSINIYDITGRLVEAVRVHNAPQTIIPIRHLNRGVYVLKIHTNKGFIIKKLIKQ